MIAFLGFYGVPREIEDKLRLECQECEVKSTLAARFGAGVVTSYFGCALLPSNCGIDISEDGSTHYRAQFEITHSSAAK